MSELHVSEVDKALDLVVDETFARIKASTAQAREFLALRPVREPDSLRLMCGCVVMEWREDGPCGCDPDDDTCECVLVSRVGLSFEIDVVEVDYSKGRSGCVHIPPAGVEAILEANGLASLVYADAQVTA